MLIFMIKTSDIVFIGTTVCGKVSSSRCHDILVMYLVIYIHVTNIVGKTVIDRDMVHNFDVGNGGTLDSKITITYFNKIIVPSVIHIKWQEVTLAKLCFENVIYVFCKCYLLCECLQR